jgi:RHH-type proline utilization regulon transcriptional repressor/proline dehydrogenase/delta 1-pyrroline-5-carboxylate dehydrogenase
MMRARRAGLAALIVRECAKPWADADAEVAEAIDFLEYYARGAVALAAGRQLISPAGERNSMTYAARGVAAVIAPWNFPLAIPTGMTAAALATGNAVVLKPAEQSPACGAALVDILHEAGVPGDVLGLLLGDGEVGRALVAGDVETIAFTGSQAVGLEILAAAARVGPRQRRAQAGRGRAGREELRDRRLGRRPRRGDPGRPRVGVLLRRSEVLGRRPGACPPCSGR